MRPLRGVVLTGGRVKLESGLIVEISRKKEFSVGDEVCALYDFTKNKVREIRALKEEALFDDSDEGYEQLRGQPAELPALNDTLGLGALPLDGDVEASEDCASDEELSDCDMTGGLESLDYEPPMW